MAISGKDGDDDNNDGGRGNDNADVNFLSSINVCLVMCSHVLLMQNWDHVNTVLDSLNRQPRNVAPTSTSPSSERRRSTQRKAPAAEADSGRRAGVKRLSLHLQRPCRRRCAYRQRGVVSSNFGKRGEK